MGVHHRISGSYLAAYAREMAWRENYRRVSNGGQYAMIAGAALAHAPSQVCARRRARFSSAQPGFVACRPRATAIAPSGTLSVITEPEAT